jgi:hypothetical protein
VSVARPRNGTWGNGSGRNLQASNARIAIDRPQGESASALARTRTYGNRLDGTEEMLLYVGHRIRRNTEFGFG